MEFCHLINGIKVALRLGITCLQVLFKLLLQLLVSLGRHFMLSIWVVTFFFGRKKVEYFNDIITKTEKK